MTTFKLAKVTPSVEPLKKQIASTTEYLKALTGKDVEASGSNATYGLVRTWTRSPMNPFLGTLHAAFDQHYPVAISPDDVWLCIAQGFALHVNANAGELRKQFVAHEGKLLLTHENKYTKGSPDNDWTESFSWFSDQIRERVGKKRDLIVSGFSTTGPIEKAASEIVLMEAMQHFFEYRELTLCGIPQVTLLGTVDDWKSIRTRTMALSEFGLTWWTDSLIPVLDQFILAAQDKPNMDFWPSFYKWENGSGGPHISGFVNRFFPYIKDKDAKDYTRKNPMLSETVGNRYRGLGVDNFPIGLSVVPFTWDYYGTEYNMEFLGGFTGTVQNPHSLEVQTAIGWAVRDVK